MDLWKYYNGDLKYPNINNYSHEKEIAKHNPNWAYEYVKTHGKNEDLEPAIAKNAMFSYYYAKNILKGPFELGEPAIAKDMEFSYYYAKNILKGPFELGEPVIAKDVEFSFYYVKYVLKKDFYLDGKLICKYEG